MEKNYGTQSFLDFLITKKGENASDINNWTIEELKTVVVEFQNSQINDQKSNTGTNPLLEDLPPAENQILKIDTIITPFSNCKNANTNDRENEYMCSYFNMEDKNNWLLKKMIQMKDVP